ncbi:hypothetical protein AB0C88_04505, partial [Streptomyces chartreusis]|uniref:hypothetical protein n=1 Tax=Streptomyces chartreusis TaxID=1969 RepID=UPI0033CED2AD
TILESMRRPLIDPTILQSIRRPLIDPTILQSIRRPLIDPTILQSMRPSLIDPSILERMRNPIPGIEALKDSRKAGRNDVDVGLGAEDAVSEEGETLDQDDDASDEG